MNPNFTVAAIAYLLTCGGFLGWIYKSNQERIPKTSNAGIWVCLRSAVLFLIFYLICMTLDLTVLAGVIMLIAFALFTLASFSIASLPGLVFFYAIQQWVLGWPDKEFLINDTVLESNRNKEKKPDPLIGQNAVVVAPLKPGGKIKVDDLEEIDATCESGFLDTGSEVTIVGKESFSYVVRLRTS